MLAFLRASGARSLVLVFLFCSLAGTALAQTTTYRGRVTDAQTGDPVPFASVALRGKAVGTTTNFEGFYQFTTAQRADSLVVTFIGYRTRAKAIPAGVANPTVDFQLEPTSTSLAEVVVRAGENPAFRILRELRERRPRNDRQRLAAYEYDSYAKTELDVDNLSEKFRKRRIVKKITGALEKAEKLAGEDGKPVIPTFVSETISKFYYRASPQRRKEVILKSNVQGVGVKDGGFISQLVGGNLFQNYNFYDNSLPFLSKDLTSPLGENWKGTYEYFLSDTVVVGDNVCFEIEFEPKRKQDLAFTGTVWIDTTAYALRQIDATLSKEANLNFIEKLKIQQELEPVPDSSGKPAAWLPARTRFLVDVSELTKNSAGVLAKFYIANRNFRLNDPQPLSFYDQASVVADDARETSPAFWAAARPDSLTREDRLARQLIDSVRNLPIVRTYVDVAEIVTTGWKKYRGIEFGPYIYSLAYNSVEGLRLRVGARTNDAFSRHWILRGFLAYGTLDGKFKYGGEVNYLFSRRHWTVAGIRYSRDLERVGLDPDQISNNKLFYAFTRFGQYRGAYFRGEKTLFVQSEVMKGLTLSGTLSSRSFDPLFPFRFRTEPQLGEFSPMSSHFDYTQLTLEARFAKNETYIQDGNERITLGTKRIPVVTVRYQRGLKGVLGGYFNYDRFQVTAFQTFRLGSLGRSSYLLSAGYTPSVVPAPLLFPHLGNETWFYNRFAFNMMNYFEYVSDRYASVQWQHNFEGLLFNRIPGIRKLKWRLVGTANVLFGDQSHANETITARTFHPKFRQKFEFASLDPARPYVELGYGIDNIFKIFRVQAIHRLTYLEGGVDRFAVKGSVHFSF
jgi:hypothetical protein